MVVSLWTIQKNATLNRRHTPHDCEMDSHLRVDQVSCIDPGMKEDTILSWMTLNRTEMTEI